MGKPLSHHAAYAKPKPDFIKKLRRKREDINARQVAFRATESDGQNTVYADSCTLTFGKGQFAILDALDSNILTHTLIYTRMCEHME